MKETRKSLNRVIGLLFFLSVSSVFAQRGPQDRWIIEDGAIFKTPTPWGIAYDAGRIYVSNYGADRIDVYNTEGVFLEFFGRNGANDLEFADPYGLALFNDELYAVEQGNSRIQVLSTNGVFKRKWGSFGAGEGQFNGALDIAVDETGVYVADTQNDRIQVFSLDGTFLREWGEPGSVLGTLDSPATVATDRNYVYVADYYATKGIQVYDKQGSYVRNIAQPRVRDVNVTPRIRDIVTDEHTLYVSVYGQGATALVWLLDKNTGALLQEFRWVGNTPYIFLPNQIAINPPYFYLTHPSNRTWHGNQYSVIPFKRVQRTLGSRIPNAAPLVGIDSVAQRAGEAILDVDFYLSDSDSSNLTVWAAAFASTEASLSLDSMVPMRTFIEGTATNIGPGLSTGVVRHLVWDMEADQIGNHLTDYGRINVAMMAKDDRGLIDLHYLHLPAYDGNPTFKINRAPLREQDFLSAWFWLLSSGESSIALVQTGRVVGVGGDYDDELLAQGTLTTARGRDFLFEQLGGRAPAPAELKFAFETDSEGYIAKRSPLRSQIADPLMHYLPGNYSLNEFNFVSEPTNGWWIVVPMP